jgi:hypothetical protein
VFRGICQSSAKLLTEFLQQRGISGQRVGGYYCGASEKFFKEMGEPIGDGKWKHWWVEVDGVIIDTTADQFHPGEEEEYRVVLTTSGDTNYESGPARTSLRRK